MEIGFAFQVALDILLCESVTLDRVSSTHPFESRFPMHKRCVSLYRSFAGFHQL